MCNSMNFKVWTYQCNHNPQPPQQKLSYKPLEFFLHASFQSLFCHPQRQSLPYSYHRNLVLPVFKLYRNGIIVVWSLLCLVSLPASKKILSFFFFLVFSKTQLLISLIFCIFLFSVLLISALTFIISSFYFLWVWFALFL